MEISNLPKQKKLHSKFRKFTYWMRGSVHSVLTCKLKMKSLFATKVLLFVLLICVLLFIRKNRPVNTAQEKKIYANVPTEMESKVKKILLWNDHFGKKDFGVGLGGGHFIKNRCPVKDCITIAADNNPYPMSEIDALIYHPASNKKYLPEERYSKTRYIFFYLESPPTHCRIYGCKEIKQFSNVFNYTMTYRKDSDVYISWGYFNKGPRTFPRLKQQMKMVKRKSKMIAWMVSDCNTPGQRKRIVNALQEYIPVDIYGRCGPFKCSKDDKSSCFDMLERDYKFHLSFENSLCKDYVTEKLFLYAARNIVPVVYSAMDYSKIAPYKSYIDVANFDNVTHLANYLMYLDKNHTAYLEYFQWKKNYGIKSNYADAWCDLCAKLHQDKETKVYEDFYAWYEKDKCISPEPFLSKFIT